MAAAVPFLALGLSAATSVFEGFSESQGLKAQAGILDSNAKAAQLDGAYSREDIRRRGRAVQGEAIAASADLAGSVGGGSIQDLLFQNALETEYAAQSATYQADRQAAGLRSEAAAKRKAAKNAMIGGFLRAGASALTGAANISNQGKVDAARQQRQEAYFPGGQRLPMPTYGGGMNPDGSMSYSGGY